MRMMDSMTPTRARDLILVLAHDILEDLRSGAIAQHSVRMEHRRRRYESQLEELLTIITGKVPFPVSDNDDQL